MLLCITILYKEILSIKNLFLFFNKRGIPKLKDVFHTSEGEKICALITEEHLKTTRLLNTLSEFQRLQEVQTSNKISDYICEKEKFYSLLLEFALEHSSAIAVSYCDISKSDVELFTVGLNSERFKSNIKNIVRTKIYGEGLNESLICDENSLAPFGIRNVCFFRLTWEDGGINKNAILAFYYPIEKSISVGEERILREIKDKIENNLTAKYIINNLGNRVEEVENLNRRNSDAIKNVSHDLRSPINNIKASLTLLENTKNEDDVSELLKIGQRNCNIILSFVNDILNFAQFNSGGVEPNLQSLSFVKEINSLIDDFQILAAAKGLTIISDIPEKYENNLILVDLHHFRRILLNLISNSVKYTKEGSIKISVNEDSNHEIIIVSDTGVGMTPEQLKLLGTPFSRFQTDMAQGSGLGISLVKRLVQANNGEIFYTSQFDKGTEVKIIFPKVKGEIKVEEINRDNNIKKILIVDNDLDCVLSTGRILEKSGYKVFSAVDVNQACLLLNEEYPDFLITDLNMPNGGGEKIVSYIEKSNLTTKVFVVSGIEKDEFQKKYPHLMVTSFFTKPLDFKMLFNVLNGI